ncbi:MAG: GNAT family N-acetyltransferase [Chloroflexota bacterium]
MQALPINAQLEKNEVGLQDGSIVTIRKIRADDVDRLIDFSTRLSSETKYSRYLSYRRAFSESEATQLCTTQAGIRMALVAEVEGWGETNIVGLAEYEKMAADMAEVGIVVADQSQGLGLGTHMLNELVKYAKREGLNVFAASVHPDNTRILNFIQKSELPLKKHLSYGAWEFQVKLAENR